MFTFTDLPWHDAIIENIIINRSNPGEDDKIDLIVIWPDTTKVILHFKDVYKASLDLNFGVIADETIFKAFMLEENDTEFEKLRSKWQSLMDDFPSIKCYVIQTASTGSLIKIFAKEFIVGSVSE